MKDIEPKLKTIKNYLIKDDNEGYFRIPEYQRPYSWGIAQCDKLLQDIEDYIDSDNEDPYFFGTIIVDCSDEKHRDLIDGQQRTTTFYLLLKALLLRIQWMLPNIKDEESASLKAGLEERRKEILKILFGIEAEDVPDFLKNPESIKSKKIPLENSSINEFYKEELGVILRSTSFEEAEKSVYHFRRKQKDNKYTDFFRNFKFFYEKMSEKEESVLNNFARKFLNKCQVIEIKSWNVEQAIVMFNSLNSTGMPLTDADVLSAQLYSYANGSESFITKWSDLNDSINKLNEKGILDLQTVFGQYMYIYRAENGIKEVQMVGLRPFYLSNDLLKDPEGFIANLKKIADNWEKVSDSPLTRLLLKFNQNARFFIATYLYAHGTSSFQIPFECLLRLFAILEIVDYGYSSKSFKQFLFEENIKFANKDTSNSEIADDFRAHIRTTWKQEDICNALLDSGVSNLLVLLNEYVYCKDKARSFYFTEPYNIEHIMPASGKNIISIRQDAGIADDEFKEIVDRLGNKIPLEEDINKSIGNEWFKTKKQSTVTSKNGYQNSRYQIASDLTGYPSDKWIKEDIDKATQKAAKRIVEFLFE